MKTRTLRRRALIGILILWGAVRALPEEAGRSPGTSVQIVNATSVPSIALHVNGRLHYPDFPQGLYTGDASSGVLRVEYRAVEPVQGLEATGTVGYRPKANQTLILTGDFSLSATGESPTPGRQAKRKPNVQFRVFSHELGQGEEPLRYRFLNAMPKVAMTRVCQGGGTEVILPGETRTLSGQKPVGNYQFVIEGRPYEVPIHQQGTPRNCIICFYLERGTPRFVRAFEGRSEGENAVQ